VTLSPFRVVYQGKHGPSVVSDNPKLDAYKEMAFHKLQGRTYSTTFHADGAVTVAVDGLEPLTFEADSV
jgi:hypothetical protein